MLIAFIYLIKYSAVAFWYSQKNNKNENVQTTQCIFIKQKVIKQTQMVFSNEFECHRLTSINAKLMSLIKNQMSYCFTINKSIKITHSDSYRKAVSIINIFIRPIYIQCIGNGIKSRENCTYFVKR